MHEASEVSSCLPPPVRGHAAAELRDAVLGVRNQQGDGKERVPLLHEVRRSRTWWLDGCGHELKDARPEGFMRPPVVRAIV